MRDIRAAMICPVSVVEAARGLSETLGEGRSFAVPLSETGVLPATHYGLSAGVSDQFLGLILKHGTLVLSDGFFVRPSAEFNTAALEQVVVSGASPENVAAVLSKFTVIASREIDATGARAQFNALLDHMGLKRIVDDPDA